MENCVIIDTEFALLLSKAQGEFEWTSHLDDSGVHACSAHTLVQCIYWDAQELERAQ
jgi:hypothetical protein